MVAGPGQRDWYPRFDPGAVAVVLGLLNPAIGVHPGDQITTVVRNHDVHGGVGGCGQLGHPPA